MKYINDFCDKHFSYMDVDEYTGEPTPHYSLVPDQFVNNYDKTLTTLPKHFNRKEYDNFKALQKQIQYFQLDKEAFWYFLVFLYSRTNSYFKNKWSSYGDKIKETNQFITAKINEGLKVTFTSGRRKIEITDPFILKSLFATFQLPENYWQDIKIVHPIIKKGQWQNIVTLKEYNPAWVEPEEATERKKSYFVIKTIADELIHERPEGVAYTNQEKILYLCILYLCQYLIGDTTKEYTYKNVAPVSQLLKDFEGTEVIFVE